MAKVEQQVLVPASLADAWDLYFEPRLWPDWVDSFGSVIEIDGYPGRRRQAALEVRSLPAGARWWRRSSSTSTRRKHRIEFSDPSLAGEMTVTFADRGRGRRRSSRRWTTACSTRASSPAWGLSCS